MPSAPQRNAASTSAPELALLSRLARASSRAMRRLARGILGDPELARVLPLEPEEEAFLRDLGTPEALGAPVVPRVDTNAPFGARDFAARLRVYEVNGVGIGGLHYAPACERLVHGLLSPGDRRRLRPLPDLARALAAAACAVGRRLGAPRPRISLCEETTEGTGTTEFVALAEALRHLGFAAKIVDARELRERRGVEVVYRDTEIRDLLALGLPRPARQALVRAFREGRVLSGPAGDLDHKSLLEVCTDARLAERLPAEDRRLLARHFLWTRLLRERRTMGPRGKEVDLVPFAREHRAELVVKPNRMYGGKDVIVGPFVDAGAWEAALAAALAQPDTHVVQAYAPVAREVFAGADGPEELSVDAGVILAGRALGILSRAARDPVVNVARGGGLVPVLRQIPGRGRTSTRS